MRKGCERPSKKSMNGLSTLIFSCVWPGIFEYNFTSVLKSSII